MLRNALRQGMQFAFGGGGEANQRTNAIERGAYPRKRPKPGDVDYTIGNDYPINLDAGEHFMRLRTGADYFPYPPRIGAMQEFMRQADLWVWFTMYKKAAVGPDMYYTQGMAGIPVPVANLQWQYAVPGLTKTA